MTLPAEHPATADLARSGISAAEAEAAGMWAVDDLRRECGEASYPRAPGLVISYHDADGHPLTYKGRDGALCLWHRVRVYGTDAGPKYRQPPMTGVQIYLAPGVPWRDVMAEPALPVVITEGEKKALAACLSHIPTIGLGGVYQWRSRGEPVPDLDDWDWTRRRVFIAFDSDAVQKTQVAIAEWRLREELHKRGAEVELVRLPQGPAGEKQGLDDWLLGPGANLTGDALREALPVIHQGHLYHELRRLQGELVMLKSAGGKLLELQSARLDRVQSFSDPRAAKASREDFMFKPSLLGLSQMRDGSDYAMRMVAVEVPKPTAKEPHRKVQVNKQVTEIWLRDSVHCHVYSDITFNPGTTELAVPKEDRPSPMLNLFSGFPWARRGGNIAPLRRLYERLMASTEPQHQEVLWNALAWKMQNPAYKLQWAPALLSPQKGTGKSLFARLIADAFGPYGYMTGADELETRFNDHLIEKLLIVVDEVRPLENEADVSRFKQMITNAEFRVEGKFRDSKVVPNYAAYLLTSNELTTVFDDPLDRRSFVVQTPGPAAPQFYTEILNWAKGDPWGGVAGALLDWPVTEPPQRAPQTEAFRTAVLGNMPPDRKLLWLFATRRLAMLRECVGLMKEWVGQARSSGSPEMQSAAKEVAQALGAMRLSPLVGLREACLLLPSAAWYVDTRTKADWRPEYVSRALRAYGLPVVTRADAPEVGFTVNGRPDTVFSLDPDDMRFARGLTQAEFDDIRSRAERI